MSSTKKKVVAALLISLIVFPFWLSTAKASDFGGSWANFYQYYLKEFTLDTVARGIAKALFNGLVNKLVSKIQSGGRNGGPAYVQNWRNFQTNAQYRGEDVFRAILANTPICGYLRTGIDQVFRTSARFKIPLLGQNIRVGDLDPYTLRARCSLPSNFDPARYQQDFTGNGGWQTYVQLLQPENNFYGLYLQSLQELGKQRDLEERSDLQEAAGGYTAFRPRCAGQGAQTRCIFLGRVVTPPDLIAKAAGTILQQNLEWLTNADEMSDIVAGVATYAYNYFSDLSAASNLGETPEDRSTDSEKFEYCTARKPRKEIVEKYSSQFNPFGYAKGDIGPCGDPNSKKNRENQYPYQACVQACLKAVGLIPSNYPVPSVVPYLPVPTETDSGTCPDLFAPPGPGGGAVCHQGCGGSPGDGPAYLLRVGHLDQDSVSKKLFNSNGDPDDHTTWEWFLPPDTKEEWCSSDTVLERTDPPPNPPPFPATIRCINGSSGGIDYSQYPLCGPVSNPSGTPGPSSTPGAGECQIVYPAGVPGPFAEDIKAAAKELRETTSGILSGGGWPYTVLDIDGYFEGMEQILESRGFVVTRDTDAPDQEINIYKQGSSTSEMYGIRTSGGLTRASHRASGCTLP